MLSIKKKNLLEIGEISTQNLTNSKRKGNINKKLSRTQLNYQHEYCHCQLIIKEDAYIFQKVEKLKADNILDYMEKLRAKMMPSSRVMTKLAEEINTMSV